MSILRRFVILCLALPLCANQSSAQTTGVCDSPLGEAYLDANNVRARILNTGGLFYRGDPYVYYIPRRTELQSIFAGGLWVGGKVDGQLRMAASRYGPWEYWAGPLSDDGTPPSDCDAYDRVYKVSRADIEAYESIGITAPDLTDWPTGLGAPTLDSNGNLLDLLDLPLPSRHDRLIDLDSGELPAIQGDQSIWWIMNDRGNEHMSSEATPLGIEVHGFAYAAASELDAIDDATLYNYRIRYLGTETVDSVYIGLFFDPEIGAAKSDWAGSDTLRGLVFALKGDNDDEERYGGYGVAPPAVGVQLLEGPHAESDGRDNDRDGETDENGERFGMTNFLVFNNGGGVSEDPRIAQGYYYYMQSRWKDGKHLTVGGSGREFSDVPTNFSFPGDLVAGEFWSEINRDGLGTSNSTADRKFVLSAGPMTFEPGEETDLSFAIVWARGTDYINSLAKLKKTADVVKAAFDSGFSGFPRKIPPTEPVSLLSPANGMDHQPVDPMLFWTQADNADTYTVEVISVSGIDSYSTTSTSIQLENLPPNEIVYWRVRGENTGGIGPWSDLSIFWTTNVGVLGSLGFRDFLVVRNAEGPVEPPDGAVAGWRNYWRTGPTERQQAGNGRWIVSTAMSVGCPSNCGDYESFVARSIRNGWTRVIPFDYEIRFTANGSLHYDRFNYSGGGIIVGDPLPFELWNVGISTPDDTSDDVRLIPAAIDLDNDGWGITSIDHEGSSGNDDPSTDWFYWYEPVDMTPGSIGYDAWAADALAGGDPGGVFLGPEIMARFVLFNWNGGPVIDQVYNQELPEEGTVFRLVSTGRPLAPFLAAPSYGSSLPPGEVAFYWNAVERDPVRIQVSDRADYTYLIVDSLDVTPGFTVQLDDGVYYWRVLSQYGGASASWNFEVGGGNSGVNSDVDSDLPHRYELFANYPNPFKASTVIAFDLPSASHVSLNVYDVIGRRLQTLLDGQMPPGRHQIVFDAQSLSSGSYFYTLRADGFFSTKMMVLSK